MEDNTINDIEETSVPTDFDYIDTDNIEDISDVYVDEVLEDVLSDTDHQEESSSDVGTGNTYDDSNLLSALSDINTSIDSYTESIEHISHRLDQNYDMVISITLMFGAFIAITIFRKLFDFLV